MKRETTTDDDANPMSDLVTSYYCCLRSQTRSTMKPETMMMHPAAEKDRWTATGKSALMKETWMRDQES